MVLRYSTIAILAISCATLLAWTLHSQRADSDLVIEVRELEQFALKFCGFGSSFSAANPDDRYFLERAKACYAAVLNLNARYDVDELTVARAHLRMGMILVACAEPRLAIQPLRTAWFTLADIDRFPLLDEDNKSPDAQELAADCASHLAAVLAATQQTVEAEQFFAISIKHYKAEAHRKNGLVRLSINLAGTEKLYGDMLMSQRRWRDAERNYRRAERTCENLLRDPAHPYVINLMLAQLKESRTRALERLGDAT